MNIIDNLKTHGFYIESVKEEQWQKWAPRIQEITGLTWNGGDDLDATCGLSFPTDIGYLPNEDTGVTCDWGLNYNVPFHYETLADFLYDIWESE